MEGEGETEELSGPCTKSACSGGRPLSRCHPAVNNLSSLRYQMTLYSKVAAGLRHPCCVNINPRLAYYKSFTLLRVNRKLRRALITPVSGS